MLLYKCRVDKATPDFPVATKPLTEPDKRISGYTALRLIIQVPIPYKMVFRPLRFSYFFRIKDRSMFIRCHSLYSGYISHI